MHLLCVVEDFKLQLVGLIIPGQYGHIRSDHAGKNNIIALADNRIDQSIAADQRGGKVKIPDHGRH